MTPTERLEQSIRRAREASTYDNVHLDLRKMRANGQLGFVVLVNTDRDLLCTAAEQNAATTAESVRVATEELRGQLRWSEAERAACAVGFEEQLEEIRTERDRTQGTCDQLMHELNAICAERDALRRALELCERFIRIHASVRDTEPGNQLAVAALLQLADDARAALAPRTKSAPCASCNGTGYAPNCTATDRERGDMWSCAYCDGTGRAPRTEETKS